MTSARVSHFKRHLPWAAAWLLASVIGVWIIAHTELSRLREAFDNEAYTAHRLLSQKMAQLDTVMAALPVSSSASRSADDRLKAEQRLLQTAPHILSLQRRDGTALWADEALQMAEEESNRRKQPVLANINLAKGRFGLVLGGQPVSYAILVDIKAMVPWREWPMVNDASPVRVTLRHDRQEAVLQAGAEMADHASGWPLVFRQPLSALSTEQSATNSGNSGNPDSPSIASPPSVAPNSLPSGDKTALEFIAERQISWGELPWSRMLSWSLLIALLLLTARALLRQRHDRYRADGLLRIGQAGQLNTLAELAAGMAQELADPLAAVLDATQSAERWLADSPPDTLSAHASVRQASDDARHLANVVDRLHHVVQRPDLSGQLERISLRDAARSAVDLLQPQWDQLSLSPTVVITGPDFTVLAAPQALAQIIHNLLINAAQALEQVPVPQRSLSLVLHHIDKRGYLSVQDTGPGLANNVVTHIFEPFFTTRKGALGLGLSLCETLASSMGGTLTAFNRVPRGAEFCLTLPLSG